MVSSNCQGEAHTLPNVVVRTSFKIFRALFDVRSRMRRLSQARSSVKHGELECKHALINSSNNFFELNECKQSQVSKESAR